MAKRSTKVAWVAVALLATAVALPTTASAARGRRAGWRFMTTLEELNLSAAQQVQVKQILSTAMQAKLTPTVPHTAGGHRVVMKEIMAVLTPTQQVKLKQLLAASRPVRPI